jgi:hypothetical protein
MPRNTRPWHGSSVAALAALILLAAEAGSEPLAAFEVRCAQLPASHFNVTMDPIAYAQDETQSIDQLNLRSGHTPGMHLTFGLTSVNFAFHTTVEIRSLEDRDRARACGTLDVDVGLSMQPITIYLAQELDGSPCARTATMEHELKHVAVFRAVLDEAARDLAADLAGAIGTGLQRARGPAELQRQLNARVNDYLAEFMNRRRRELNDRQNEVDSPQEYARVKYACSQ